MRRLLALALVLSIPIVLSACGGGGKPATVSQQVPAAGATVTLGKDVTLLIPPGALADGTKVTITKKNAPKDALPGGDSLSSGYDIDLGGQTLAKPVTLEIAFDPKKLPSAGVPFLAYYDETKGSWIPVSGTIDEERHVVVIETDHLSWWNPFSWNWANWRVILDSILTVNVTQFLESIVQSSKGCQPGGTTVTVNKTNAHDIIQGCVDRDDPEHPELRVMNQRTFFVDVRPSSGGNGYPESKLLGPGEELAFTASTADTAPLVVSADLTQKAGVYLVIHLFIQMLPGFRELGISAPQISCIVEELHDVSYVAAASEALVVSHNGAAAAEQLINMLRDAEAVRRFITGASNCSYAGARTWSVEGIQQIGSAVATIHSAVDFVVNYFRNNHSELAFNWTQPPTPTTTAYDGPFTYCAAVGTIKGSIGQYFGAKLSPTFVDAFKVASGRQHVDDFVLWWQCRSGEVWACAIPANGNGCRAGGADWYRIIPITPPRTAEVVCAQDASFCDFVRAVNAALVAGDYATISSLVEFAPYACSAEEARGDPGKGYATACIGLAPGSLIDVVGIGICQGGGRPITRDELPQFLSNARGVYAILYPIGAPSARCGEPTGPMLVTSTSSGTTWEGIKASRASGTWRIVQFVSFQSPNGDPNCLTSPCRFAPEFYLW